MQKKTIHEKIQIFLLVIVPSNSNVRWSESNFGSIKRIHEIKNTEIFGFISRAMTLPTVAVTNNNKSVSMANKGLKKAF